MGTLLTMIHLRRDRKILSLEMPRLGRSFSMGISAIVLLTALSTVAEAETPNPILADSVSLKIVVDDEKAEFEFTPLDSTLSLADVMKKVAAAEKEFSFKSRGRGDTFFVTEINGQKNEGARGRNWIFKVNGKLGNKSAGIFEIKAGDKVEWIFKTYRPTP